MSSACGIDFSDGGLHVIDFACTTTDLVEVSNGTRVRVESGGSITGGPFPGSFSLIGGSSLEVFDGFVDSAYAQDGTFSIHGGSVGNALTDGSLLGAVTVTGGSVDFLGAFSSDARNITISGGTIDSLGAHNLGDVMISGGTLAHLSAENASRVLVTNVNVTDSFLIAANAVDVALHGGSFTGTMGGGSGGVGSIEIHGIDFAIEGARVGPGPLDDSAIGARLTGTLLLGGTLDVQVLGAITLVVPEPATAALVAGGLAGLCAARRRRKAARLRA